MEKRFRHQRRTAEIKPGRWRLQRAAMVVVGAMHLACASAPLLPDRVVVSEPAIVGHVPISDQHLLQAAIRNAVEVGRLHGVIAKAPHAHPARCERGACLYDNGYQHGCAYAIQWSVTRRRVVWVRSESIPLVRETPSGNRHAIETIAADADTLHPLSAPSATWNFKLDLLAVRNRKVLADFTSDCNNCTVDQAAIQLTAATNQLLGKVVPQ